MTRGAARAPSGEELRWITERAVADIIPRDEFIAALTSGPALRLKMGFDPSAPDLTLGHAVGLRKLRQLQDLGHTIVVIVGDWTARIGDPSGQSKTRPMLTVEQVNENAETYLRQFSRIVDRELTEIRWQSEWFDEFTLTTVVNLAAKFTVAQMLERGDFAERFAGKKPIGIHELLYPLLQAYDSVAVKADVEFGGTDQTFNLMVGRQLQPEFGQKPQAVFTVPLLVGTDGVKMSKTQGNYVALEESPGEMFGKLMSITDPLVGDYFELLTDVPDEDLAAIRDEVAAGGTGARDAKMRLAREIVSQFHGVPAANEAEEEFRRVFSKREAPEEARDFAVAFNGAASMEIDLAEAILSTGVVSSKSEVRRLISQGAVEVEGAPVGDVRVTVREGAIIRIGKHRFVRIVDSDKADRVGG
jgi:tyrosyl-tRNA synthetase